MLSTNHCGRPAFAVAATTALLTALTASSCADVASHPPPAPNAPSAPAPTRATSAPDDDGGSHWTLNTKIQSHCWSTNNHVDCDFTLTSDPESTVPFEWIAGSDPPGAFFSRGSGSIGPGQIQTVHGSADLGCHVYFAFVDQQHHSEEHENWKSGNC